MPVAPPYAHPAAGSSYAPQAGGFGYGAPNAGGYGGGGPGYGFGAQGSSRSNRTLWIALGVVGLLVVLGVLSWLVISRMSNASGEYGSDPDLDNLYDACKNEDWKVCDSLYEQAEPNTDYRDFGDTCGEREEPGTLAFCTEAYESDPSSDPSPDPSSEPSPEQSSEPSPDPGVEPDAAVDVLYEARTVHDMQACDELFYEAVPGSEHAEFASTCGGATRVQRWALSAPFR